MKTLSTARQTYLDTGQTTDAWFARIVREDGATIGMTDHVEDLTIGSVLYQSASGYTPSASSSNIQMQPGVIDVEGVLGTIGVTRADIAAGLYDNAVFYFFITDYTNPVADDQKMGKGFFGKVSLDLGIGRYGAEITSLATRLLQSVGRTDSGSCDTGLGSARCGITLAPSAWAASTAYTEREAGDAKVGDIVKPTTENGYFYHCTTAGTSDSSEPTWPTTVDDTVTDNDVVWTCIRAYTLTGSVTTTDDREGFTDSTRTEPDDWWTGGTLTVTSGDNAGFAKEIKSSTSAGVLAFFEPFPYDFALTDAYTIEVGCRKRHIEDCVTKFSNWINGQNQPYKPTSTEATKFGGQ